MPLKLIGFHSNLGLGQFGGVATRAMAMAARRVVSELSSSLLSSGMFAGEISNCVSILNSSELPSLQEALEKGLNAFHCRRQDECERWCDVVIDYTWEKLHSGVWSDVSVGWRNLYALSSLLKAMSIASGKKECLDTALLALDKGILLGAPVLGGALTSFAASLSSHIASTKLSPVVGRTIVATNPPSQSEQPTSLAKRREIKLRNYKSVKLSEDSSDHDGDLSTCTKRLKSDTDREPATTDLQQTIPVKHNPSLNEFLAHHMRSAESVVLTGCMGHWPALSCRKWRYGELKSPVHNAHSTPEGGTSQLYHATPWDLCKNTLECVTNPRATPSGLSNIPSCILHRSLEGMV